MKKDTGNIRDIMKFFIAHQIKKGEIPKLTPVIYHNIGVKKNSLNDIAKVLPVFREILGDDYIQKFISKFENKPINVNDYDDNIGVGGYDFIFKFDIYKIFPEKDFYLVELNINIEQGGEVTLMTDGETYTFEEMDKTNHEAWQEVQQEIIELIFDILRYKLTDYTGLQDFSIEKLKYF